MPFVLHHHDPATLQRRKRLAYTWGGIVVSWSAVRTLIVWAAVGEYGLNPWIYICLDLASAFTDAVTTPRMVISFIDDHLREAVMWGVISLGAFIVPDVYIFLGSRTLPLRVIIVILAIIGATLTIGVIGVTRKIRKGRELKARIIRV